jgi:UDP-hydrolysing UDP-N-acetyl-D-glucosamine 2-epimerase
MSNNVRNRKKKIAAVIFNRASYFRLTPVLSEIQKHPLLDLQVIVGSSMMLERYGTAIEILKKDGFPVHYTFYSVFEGENPYSMTKSTAATVDAVANALDNLKPDLVIAHGDRYEALATAIAASFMNIPLAHTMAGELCGTIDGVIRHAITRLAHAHFATNRQCYHRLIQWGEEPNRVFITGCPGMDMIKNSDLSATEDFLTKYRGTGSVTDFKKPYLIVLHHPVTTEYGQGRRHAAEVLNAVYGLRFPTVWFWPNVDAGSDEISKEIRTFREHHYDCNKFMYFVKNLSPEDFLKLLNNAVCIVGNSSAGIRESSFMGIPSVNIGTRQKDRERGDNAIDVGYNSSDISAAVRKQILHGRYQPSDLYGDGHAAGKIVKILNEKNFSIHKNFISPTQYENSVHYSGERRI